MPLARVRKHLNRLSSVGVARVDAARHTYRLDAETLRWAAEQVGPSREAGMALGAASDDEEAVLRTFFRDGRLTEIPAKASKRRIVLERVALEFEPGTHYREPEVNAIVGRFHNDHAALRRYLVDERLLDRDHGVYWRSGGRVDPYGRCALPQRRVDAARGADARFGGRPPTPPEPSRAVADVRAIRSDDDRSQEPADRRGGRLMAIAALILTLAPTASAQPALGATTTPPGPCPLVRTTAETVQHFSKRVIRCAAATWVVPGGAAKAICIASRESGLVPTARSASGRYQGLYLHSAHYWASRYAAWTVPAWHLRTTALNGRTNAVVTFRMVHSAGGWAPAGWRVRGC